MFFRSQELQTTTSSSQSLVRIQAFVSSRRFVPRTKHSFSVRSPVSATAREPSYLSAFAQDHWYGASRLPNRVYNSSKLPRKWRRCLVLELCLTEPKQQRPGATREKTARRHLCSGYSLGSFARFFNSANARRRGDQVCRSGVKLLGVVGAARLECGEPAAESGELIRR